MRVLITGTTPLARTLAGDLERDGHDVRTLEGDEALAEAALTEAVAGRDAIVTAGRDDATNAVVALTARRELQVPLAIAVVSGSARAEALTGMGVRVVCPTTRTVRELHHALARSGIESELLPGGEVGLYRAEVPARLSGRTVAELDRPGRVLPVAVQRGGRVVLAAPGVALAHGDVLHVAALRRDDVDDLVGP